MINKEINIKDILSSFFSYIYAISTFFFLIEDGLSRNFFEGFWAEGEKVFSWNYLSPSVGQCPYETS